MNRAYYELRSTRSDYFVDLHLKNIDIKEFVYNEYFFGSPLGDSLEALFIVTQKVNLDERMFCRIKN